MDRDRGESVASGPEQHLGARHRQTTRFPSFVAAPAIRGACAGWLYGRESAGCVGIAAQTGVKRAMQGWSANLLLYRRPSRSVKDPVIQRAHRLVMA